MMTGCLAPNERLPAERMLAEELGVARGTLRTALSELQDEGLLEKEFGRGWLVLPSDAGPDAAKMAKTIAVVSDMPLQESSPGAVAEFGWHHQVRAGAIATARSAGFDPLEIRPGLLSKSWANGLAASKPAGVALDESVLCHSESFEALWRAQIPTVCAANEDSNADTVASDHQSGGADLTRWLLKQGRRRILRVWPENTGDPRNYWWLRDREAGFREAMHEAACEPLAPLVMQEVPCPGQYSLECFQRSVQSAIGYLRPALQKHPIDAIMTASDGIALIVTAAYRAIGQAPNRDVLITGYDNYAMEHYAYTLGWERELPAATVDKLNLRTGREMVRLLIERINGNLPPEPQHRLIEPVLLISDGRGFPPVDHLETDEPPRKTQVRH